MRNVLLLAALATTLLPSCIFGCGAYTGAGDRTYQRGTESMIICANGGFAANLTTGAVEGRYTFDGTVTIATREATQTVAFTLTDFSDGTATAPELGALAWEKQNLDKTALDHADVQCTDLESRSWWTGQ
jgi:hypothetical protein